MIKNNNQSFRIVYYKNGQLDKRRTYPALLKYAAYDLLHGRKPVKVRVAYSNYGELSTR